MKWLVVDRWVTLVLVYRFFHKKKPYAARNKGFRTYVDSTLRPSKRNYYSIIKRKFWLKSLNTGSSMNNFAKPQMPFSSYIIYCFYPGILMFGIDPISSLLDKLI